MPAPPPLACIYGILRADTITTSDPEGSRMELLATVLVCTVEIDRDLHIGAVWNGGPAISVHVDRCGQTSRVAKWPIWNPEWDCPLIQPTPDSLGRFVTGRLQEPGVLDALIGVEAA